MQAQGQPEVHRPATLSPIHRQLRRTVGLGHAYNLNLNRSLSTGRSRGRHWHRKRHRMHRVLAFGTTQRWAMTAGSLSVDLKTAALRLTSWLWLMVWVVKTLKTTTNMKLSDLPAPTAVRLDGRLWLRLQVAKVIGTQITQGNHGSAQPEDTILLHQTTGGRDLHPTAWCHCGRSLSVDPKLRPRAHWHAEHGLGG